ncbi:hypothetical protein P872_02460 [Rhodonellum psychrophilum GCM71 = DSM 17998]|uniref:Uncharacterized protein n=1 Tax=Rhodonellum psychrophilum GCM71 = DSM 17998 TaxID=1123057 RepID=U5BSW6_9BACT|nr:hypothetical protein P872_02460 [Rhodonellum psychrophilum GCM71 = DSM 17998]
MNEFGIKISIFWIFAVEKISSLLQIPSGGRQRLI